MKNLGPVIPIVLVSAGVLALLAPAVDSSSRVVAFCVAMLVAGVYGIVTRNDAPRSTLTGFKVSLKEISFVHHELPSELREGTTPEVETLYREAKDHFHKGRFSEAADLYSKAFSRGGGYWPAKVNEGMAFQADGNLERALDIYAQISLSCEIPKYRAQALGNSGNILMTLAELASDPQSASRHRAEAYEKFIAANATDTTVVSLYNVVDACRELKKISEERHYRALLEAHPDFARLAQGARTGGNS